MTKGLANRRRSTPWIQRWARPLIGTIAVLGAINTGYLTLTKLFSTSTACPTGGCEQVLSSPYATVFGAPLALFGFLAYVTVAGLALIPLAVNPESNKSLRTQLEDWTWLPLFAVVTAMLVFSGYLMNIMISKFVVPYGVNGICYYCIASALFALTLFVLTLLGRSWEDIGQLLFTGLVVAVVTLIGTLGVYAHIETPQPNPSSSATVPGQAGPPILNTSGPAEMELSRHLKQKGAKMYGAYWCPHCHDQKELFGKEAFSLLTYIECAPDGQNPQTERCQAAKIQGFPSWEISGKQVEPAGTLSLEKLADLTGYTGSREFRNR